MEINIERNFTSKMNVTDCAIFGCTNSTTNTDLSVQYYSFPKHPVIAQQWVVACWRLDAIDINLARICSIHFDNSCYTSDYKLNYLGNYTKVLKPNAVPNLYLPNPHPSIILKSDADVSSKETVDYQLETLSAEDNYAMEQHLSEDNEKYKQVTNKKQLEDIIQENVKLQCDCKELKAAMNQLQKKFDAEEETLKTLEVKIKAITDCRDSLQRASMSVADQKKLLSKVFSDSQIKILSGKKKIYWTNDDMAMGYTLRYLSNKRCYMYLIKNLNIPLPALSSLKRWITLKKDEFNSAQIKNKLEDDSE